MSARTLVLMLVYFLSGASGLIYEIVWTRQLSLVFGNTVLAASTVLSAFMAGLGLGALYIARVVDRHPSPLRLYALLEGGIGVYALLTPVLFSSTSVVYEAVYDLAGANLLIHNLVRFVLCFVILVIPTALMGATLPVISRAIEIAPDQVGRNIGSMYGANTVGAAMGCFAATFLLQRFLGLRLTLLTGVVINVAIAIGILSYLWRGGPSAPRSAIRALGPAAVQRSARTSFLAVFFVMGFSALAYEVLWVRTLILLFGATAYAFGLMLFVFLAAQGVGSLICARLADRIANKLRWLGWIEVGVFALVILTGFFLYRLPAVIYEVSVNSGKSWDAFLRTELLISCVVIAPPALLMGMAFPLGVKYMNRNLGVIGRDIGALYAANTFGAIGGALASGFVFIALFGLRASLIINSWLNLCLGIGLLLSTSAGARRRWALAVPLLLAALAASVASPRWTVTDFVNPAFYRDLSAGSGDARRDEVILHRETSAATITVQERKASPQNTARLNTAVAPPEAETIRILYIDGKVEASNNPADMRNQYLLGHLPAIIHGDPQDGLVVGLGTGATLGALASHDLRNTECVDINPYMAQAAALFAADNGDVLSNPSVKFIIEDARNYLLLTSTMYDVITSDPIHPYVAGSTNLYTREYYALCLARLKAGGVMCQWLPLYQMSVDDAKSIIRTFASVFPNMTLWAHFGDSVLIGINGRDPIDPAVIREGFEREATRRHFTQVDIRSGEALLSLLMLVPEQIDAFCGAWPIISDDRPFLEFTTPFSIYRVFDAISENLKALRDYRAGTWEHLSQLATGSGFDSGQLLELERSFDANDQLLARWIGE